MAKEIAPEVQELVDRQMGQMTGVKRELRELPEGLHDEEQVLHLMKARVETKNGILAVTNQRVIFIWMGMVRREFVDWPYDRINSVKADKGFVSHSLVFNAGGSEHRVTNIFTKEKLDAIASTNPRPHAARRKRLPLQQLRPSRRRHEQRCRADQAARGATRPGPHHRGGNSPRRSANYWASEPTRRGPSFRERNRRSRY